MTSDYSSYGNFISGEQPIQLEDGISPEWSFYVNPFFKNGSYDPRDDTPWISWITIQPKFDFLKEKGEGYDITFVLEARGHDIDKVVELENDGEKKSRIDECGWTVRLDLRIQHSNDQRITYMKRAKNSAGLRRVHEFLLDCEFYDQIGNEFPNFNNFRGTGRSEYNGKGFQLGNFSFVGFKFEQIKNEFLQIQNLITTFSNTCTGMIKSDEESEKLLVQYDFEDFFL